jgi:hypothetical protein
MLKLKALLRPSREQPLTWSAHETG